MAKVGSNGLTSLLAAVRRGSASIKLARHMPLDPRYRGHFTRPAARLGMMAKSWPGNLDNCAITVRYDADGQGETYVLPDDQDELRAMPSVKSAPPKRKRRKSPGGMSSAERDVAGIEKRGKTGSEESEKCRRLCEHGREKSYCKECGGSGICPHGRNKRYCKDCGGSQICAHG